MSNNTGKNITTSEAPLPAEQDQTRRDLERYSPRPFLKVLARFVDAAPSPEAVAAFARQFPDRYATALKALGGLAGYSTERINLDVAADLDTLSDSQLQERIAALERRIGRQVQQRLLEAEAEDAEVVEPPAAAE